MDFYRRHMALRKKICIFIHHKCIRVLLRLETKFLDVDNSYFFPVFSHTAQHNVHIRLPFSCMLLNEIISYAP